MAGRSGFRLTSDTLTPGIKRLPKSVDKMVAATFKYYEPQVENFARLNAPWTDQTSNARNGLIARYDNDGKTHSITLAHQVPYGIWLEVRFAGKYAIIMPTIDEYGPRVMGTLQKMLDRYNAGGS